MKISTRQLVAAYGELARDRIDLGFDAFLLTFTFNTLPGGPAAKTKLMAQEIQTTYSKFLTRHFRHPNKVSTPNKPLWIVSPDRPVFKHEKDNYRHQAVNDGLHYHAIALIPPLTRIKQDFADYVNENQRLFTGRERYLRHIHVVFIEDDDVEYVTGYGLKAIANGTLPQDDIIIMPFAESERSSRTRYERKMAKVEGALRRRIPRPRDHQLSEELSRVTSRQGFEYTVPETTRLSLRCFNGEPPASPT